MSEPRLRIAADVGGTFTDIACLSPDGELATCKIPSTPNDYARAIIEGIATLARGREAQAAGATVLHASTVATNAILEGKGANTALVTTLDIVTSSGSNVRIRSSSSAPAARGTYNGDIAAE